MLVSGFSFLQLFNRLLDAVIELRDAFDILPSLGRLNLLNVETGSLLEEFLILPFEHNIHNSLEHLSPEVPQSEFFLLGKNDI